MIYPRFPLLETESDDKWEHILWNVCRVTTPRARRKQKTLDRAPELVLKACFDSKCFCFVFLSGISNTYLHFFYKGKWMIWLKYLFPSLLWCRDPWDWALGSVIRFCWNSWEERKGLTAASLGGVVGWGASFTASRNWLHDPGSESRRFWKSTSRQERMWPEVSVLCGTF